MTATLWLAYRLDSLGPDIQTSRHPGTQAPGALKPMLASKGATIPWAGLMRGRTPIP